MTDLKEKVLEQSTNPGLKYMNISRRTFLKGALAVGGALALAGCGDKVPGETTPVDTVTATTPDPTVPTEPPTVEKVIPTAVADSASYPSNMPMTTAGRIIIANYAKCVGCRKCMVACSYHHYGIPDFWKSNIRVDMAYIEGGRADLPILCMKCGTFTAAVAEREATDSTTYRAAVPAYYGRRYAIAWDDEENPTGWQVDDNMPCHEACPPHVEAISKTGVGGASKIDKDLCTVCGNCIAACAEKGTGILRLSKDNKEILGMCDHCGDGYARCVLACPESALAVWGSAANIASENYIAKPEELAKRTIAMVFGLYLD